MEIINSIEQSAYKIDTTTLRTNNRAAGNSTFAIGGVSRSKDSFVVNQSLVLRINFCAKNRHLRQAAKR